MNLRQLSAPSSVKAGYDLKVTFVKFDGFSERAELSVVYKGLGRETSDEELRGTGV